MPVRTLKCRFCLLSAGFGALSAGFAEKKKNDEKNEEKKIKISRKGSPSCALNNVQSYVRRMHWSENSRCSFIFMYLRGVGRIHARLPLFAKDIVRSVQMKHALCFW